LQIYHATCVSIAINNSSLYHTWNTGWPDWILPDATRQAGEVPGLLILVVEEENGGVGTGVGGVGEKWDRHSVPVRLQPCCKWRL